jgi:hypothetical protein
MRKCWAGALGLFAALAPGAVWADSTGAPAETCDFFQAQLIGVLCGHTAYVGLGVVGGEFTDNRTTTVLSQRSRRGSSGTLVQHWDERSIFEDAILAVSPWQGVRFHVSGEAFQYDNDYTRDASHVAGFRFGPPITTAHVTGSYAGWETIGAEATIMDRQTASGRYILNLVGGAQLFPGGGIYNQRDLQQIGWESGARWNIGASGLSVDYASQTFLQRFDNPGVFRLASLSRLSLANDAYGVAAGPLLVSTSTLGHAPGVNVGWSEWRLGGQALVAPFRRTSWAVLRDMTLEASATRSLGQGGLVPDWAGAASVLDYAVAARFNFRY